MMWIRKYIRYISEIKIKTTAGDSTRAAQCGLIKGSRLGHRSFDGEHLIFTAHHILQAARCLHIVRTLDQSGPWSFSMNSII